jgi:ketopantoate reductase
MPLQGSCLFISGLLILLGSIGFTAYFLSLKGERIWFLVQKYHVEKLKQENLIADAKEPTYPSPKDTPQRP